MKEYQGAFLKHAPGKIAIIASRFNETIVERLIEGSLDALTRHGVSAEDIDIIRAPGAYELPIVAKAAIEKQQYAGCIALGVVIRGATPHFDYVAGTCASGLQTVSLDTGVPVVFGVLTTETIEQALERSGTKAGNKGFDVAMSLLETMDVIFQLHD